MEMLGPKDSNNCVQFRWDIYVLILKLCTLIWICKWKYSQERMEVYGFVWFGWMTDSLAYPMPTLPSSLDSLFSWEHMGRLASASSGGHKWSPDQLPTKTMGFCCPSCDYWHLVSPHLCFSPKRIFCSSTSWNSPHEKHPCPKHHGCFNGSWHGKTSWNSLFPPAESRHVSQGPARPCSGWSSCVSPTEPKVAESEDRRRLRTWRFPKSWGVPPNDSFIREHPI